MQKSRILVINYCDAIEKINSWMGRGVTEGYFWQLIGTGDRATAIDALLGPHGHTMFKIMQTRLLESKKRKLNAGDIQRRSRRKRPSRQKTEKPLSR
jgi:hypothetical protein